MRLPRTITGSWRAGAACACAVAGSPQPQNMIPAAADRKPRLEVMTFPFVIVGRYQSPDVRHGPARPGHLSRRYAGADGPVEPGHDEVCVDAVGAITPRSNRGRATTHE